MNNAFGNELLGALHKGLTLQYRAVNSAREPESVVGYKRTHASRPDRLCDLWGGLRPVGEGVDIDGRN